MSNRARRAFTCLAMTGLLAGCMSEGTGGEGGFVGRFLTAPEKTGPDTAAPSDKTTATAAARKDMRPKPSADAKAEHSILIEDLQARRSILPAGSSYARVADAVLAANTRAAEAELRSARLRAEAASKNWLPTLGPQISLTSLADFVASLVIEQVIFDNGRKKAERAFARADVEVAAVTLSEDTNDRVHDALALYLAAEEGRETVLRSDAALRDMGRFEWVMNQRVQGGVSNPADLAVIRQKLAELRSKRDQAAGRTGTALAELSAMSALPLSGIKGTTALPVAQARPLSVLRAEAEKNRRVAEARMSRAGALPGVTATATVGSDGSTDGALNLGGQLGFGTGARLKAAKAVEEAAALQVGEAREEAERRKRARASELAALDAQLAEAGGLVAQAKSNLDLFQRQYEAGVRQVMDVVGVYETYLRAQERATEVKYNAARLRLGVARDVGQLADGGRV